MIIELINYALKSIVLPKNLTFNVSYIQFVLIRKEFVSFVCMLDGILLRPCFQIKLGCWQKLDIVPRNSQQKFGSNWSRIHGAVSICLPQARYCRSCHSCNCRKWPKHEIQSLTAPRIFKQFHPNFFWKFLGPIWNFY